MTTNYLNTILATISIALLHSESIVSDGSTTLSQTAVCLEAGFTSGTTAETYINNLERALSTLPSHAGSISFYKTTVGVQHFGGLAYAFYLCRGDSSVKQCSSCVASLTDLLSTSNLVNYGCGDGFAYSAQNCVIRFANYSFAGMNKPKDLVSIDESQANATNFDEYNRTLGVLIPELITDTAFSSSALFATKEARGGAGKIYALAQCTPDISRRNCSECLSSAFSSIQAQSGRTNYAWAMLLSCQLRYDNASFYSKAIMLNPPSVYVTCFLVGVLFRVFG